MTIRLTLLSLAFAASALSQTTVYLRSSAPPGFVITGASNATPMVVQTQSAHGLLAGDTVSIMGVCSNTSQSSPANGIRKVKAVIDPTHFSITDLQNADVAANGPWCDGSTPGYLISTQIGGKLTAFTLASGPRGWLDGANGTLTRKLALGTQNGLTSIAVASNVATVTTSYSHGIAVNDKVSIWNTLSSVLNNSGNPYTVTAATSTTLQFPTAGVADGTYTINAACGPGGADNCARVSQLAWTGNPWWDRVVADTTPWTTGNAYRYIYDGGAFGNSGQSNLPGYWAEGAARFFVDQTNSAMLNVATYALNNIQRLAGVNFVANEAVNDAGNFELSDFASYSFHDIGFIYLVGAPYLTAPQKQTFLDKIYNDLDDPSRTLCNKPVPHRKVLVSGTAQGGSANTIVLAASDAHADGYYVNNVIQIPSGYGLVTGYTASTRTATISGSWTAPSAGAAYTIYATISRSGTTVTGYNTTFTTDVAAGDSVMGANTWYVFPTSGESYVSAVDSDTSLTVINAANVQANGTPAILWWNSQWKTGDCGLTWLQKHWAGYMGAITALYPVRGGQTSDTVVGPTIGANNGNTWVAGHLAMDFAAADDDPRAVRDLAAIHTAWFDYFLRWSLHYFTGFAADGSYYSFGRDTTDAPDAAWLIQNALQNAAPSYPSMDTAGAWIKGITLLRMYLPYPDLRYDPGVSLPVAWPARYGAQTGSNQVEGGAQLGTAWILDYGFVFAPSAPGTQYLKNWLTNHNLATQYRLQSAYAVQGLLKQDPRIPSLDYTVQPSQYLFTATSRATCAALTGWPCPATLRGDALVSRTGWTSTTDTHALFEARSYWSGHDTPEMGSLRVYKVGSLLDSDSLPSGAGIEGYDTTKVDTVIEFGGANTLIRGAAVNTPATATIIRWASANHGAWDPAYGDQNSRYAYAVADLSGAYQTLYNRVLRHFVHLKKPGAEEILVQFDDVDAANAPASIRTQVHYPQNGELAASGADYDEGVTTCPGPNGCSGLDTDRLILELENGGADAHNPQRNFGLISRFYSPGTVFVRDDSNTFTGANGHTHRVSICAGSSCGATAGTLEAVIVHKVAGSLADTTLTSAALNPDANWTGVQTADKVVLFARGGALPSAASFTTTHSGSAQYLVAGLAAGAYSVTVNGSTVLAVTVVTSGDNSLYFESTAGAVSIGAGTPAPATGAPAISGGVAISGTIAR